MRINDDLISATYKDLSLLWKIVTGDKT